MQGRVPKRHVPYVAADVAGVKRQGRSIVAAELWSQVEQHTPMREAPRGAHPTSPRDESVDYGDSDSSSGKEPPTKP